MDKKKRIILTVSVFVVVAGQAVWSAFHPADWNEQAKIDLQYHPVARVIGSLIPTMVLLPVFYWFTGRIGRKRTQ
jgi:hypothetical protein